MELKYGVSYYPEHKSAEEINEEIEILAESGINIIRMGEFDIREKTFIVCLISEMNLICPSLTGNIPKF